MTDEQGDLPSIEQLAFEISGRATGRPIGELQKLRARRKGLTQPPGLFDGRTIWDEWAYHVGGRQELQFNIGYESIDGEHEDVFRHGLAFSLQPSRTVPDISIFRERVRRFNRYLDEHPKAFNDLSM